ncbi:unnamed protein product [Prunus armeniaca]|uniref:Peptidase A1 domain-containing protein n=1 Tax=Prunus armeniaca TaxID=36596 RepID=A0A6J5VIS3_PRUAR|nr:unnamed protein product [Prunus armeniaca]
MNEECHSRLKRIRGHMVVHHGPLKEHACFWSLFLNILGGSPPLFNQIVGEEKLLLYYTKVKLGSPPKEFNVQIDTGSESLWVACNSCSDCSRSTWLPIQLSSYDSASSSTARLIPCSMCTSEFQAKCSPQTNQCSYSTQYADGSGVLGHYVSDTLHFDRMQGQSYIDSSASIIFG